MLYMYKKCFIRKRFARFLFTDYHRLTSVVGEQTLAFTMGTLCDALEAEFGTLTVRMFRVFGRQPGICHYLEKNVIIAYIS